MKTSFALVWLIGLIAVIVQTPCFGQDASASPETSSSSQRARKIVDRSKTLVAGVLNVSKGAKGVGAPISDRDAWAKVAGSPAFRKVVEEAEKFQRESIPLPTEEDYMIFYETGEDTHTEVNRDYEHKYNARRHRFFRLVLAECFENKGRFLPDIEEAVITICSEPCWSHPGNDREAKKFKGKSREIDHLTAQTAWNLATASYWLGRKLSPEVRDLLSETVQQRVLSPFENAVLSDDYGLIRWAGSADQWNAHCHASVVGAATALIDSGERRALYLAATETNVEKFLQIFTRDGYFADGIWSWNVGYGSFILMAETMYQATGGRVDLFKRPNIKETALFGPRMEITPGVYESFGNRHRGDRPQIFPTAFISKRFRMGLTEIENRSPFFGVGPGHLFMVGVYCFPNSASEQKGETRGAILPPLETPRSEFPLNGVMILRTGKKEKDQIGVQLKGGTNDERGNHSDVGTYVVALGGGKPLADAGARRNRRGLVIKDIMESNLNNSFGHPVPKIGELLQKNGKGTIAPLLERKFTDRADTLRFDLSYVYEWAEPKDLKELTRTFVFDRTGEDPKSKGKATLTVVDRFRNKKPLAFENCLITFGPFKKLTSDEEASVVELIVGEGDQAVHVEVSNEVVELSGETNKFVRRAKPIVFEAGLLDEEIPRTESRPYRLSFGFDAPVDEVTLTTVIRPAIGGERELAKKEPDEPTRVYTSPIDEVPEDEEPVEENTAGVVAVAKLAEAQIRAYADLLKQTLPAETIEKIRQLPDEQVKPAFQLYKQFNPTLQEIPDEQIDALIKFVRGE